MKLVSFSQEFHLDVYPDEEELHFESVLQDILFCEVDS